LLRRSILASCTAVLVLVAAYCEPGDLELHALLSAAALDETDIGRTNTTWPVPAPVGLQAYAQWALWPYQRTGIRAYMRSTHDRDGLNRTSDASHFLYGERPDFNVTLDVQGQGILYFVRTNRWHGSPWHYEVDGVDYVVRETSTADPSHPSPDSNFEPPATFPSPLALTWPTTKGADLNWVPVAFERSLRLAYGRTFYGTGYYIYHLFMEGAPLSSTQTPFNLETVPDAAILELLDRAGTDIAPTNIAQESAHLELEPDKPLRVFHVDASATIRAVKLSIPRERALELSHARLRITWDGRAAPSVEAPLALFFGAGLFYNRNNAEYLVKAFPVSIRYGVDSVHLAAYFPMPFFRSATIELLPPPGLDRPVSLVAELRHEPLRAGPSNVGYFHATFRNHGGGEPGRDHILLETRGIENSEHWSGSFIGTSFTFTDKAELRTLEGDPRFFFDDARSPQAHGTGTEEWGGGGDYWGGQTVTLPLAGHPIGAPTPAEARDADDLVHSAYRFLVADLFPFGRNARVQFEHGAANDMFEHYRTVTYWYGAPTASLEKTDELMVGDADSERLHDYHSPHGSAPQLLTSRYDLGPDTYVGQQGPIVVYPAESHHVRYTAGTSEFRLTIRPDNHGVMLRRTLDFAIANQRAIVSVADGDASDPVWEAAGSWYTAGSSTFYHSFPREELSPPNPVVHTSNRHFLEDEFLLPLRLTTGRKSIRIRLVFDPVDRPLLPSLPSPKSAWSEIRYVAYCWVTPAVQLDDRALGQPE
jgi:Protein of unknown function (DUF2961)